MNRFLKNLQSVDIPKEAYLASDPHTGDHRVRVYLKISDTSKIEKRVIIGWAQDKNSSSMQPNMNYLKFYPKECDDILDKSHNNFRGPLHIGLYSIILSIATTSDIYNNLCQIYGIVEANAILDYCMYNILERSNVTSLFTNTMNNQVLFSDHAYSDTWYSNLFNKEINETLNVDFRKKWLDQCIKMGVKNVWISVDGSNYDCTITNSDLPTKGNSKSGKNLNIISYIQVVDADSGLPIFYFINYGHTVDCKAIQNIIPMLNKCNITVLGIILDRGFCTIEVFNLLKEYNYEYIVMLKNSTLAHKVMVNQYKEILPWNILYLLDTKDIIFGVNKNIKVFGLHDNKLFVNLYYEPSNSLDRRVDFLKKLKKEFSELRLKIFQGKTPEIPNKFKKYINIEKKNNKYCIYYNNKEIQNNINTKGFYCIASSIKLLPSYVHDIYRTRDSSEKQIRTTKTDNANNTTRVHSTAGVYSKFLIDFISSIFRWYIRKTCKKFDFDTNKIIKEINEISINIMDYNTYYYANLLTNRQKKFLSDYNITNETFIKLTFDINSNISNNNIKHIFPEINTSIRRKRGRPPKEISSDSNKDLQDDNKNKTTVKRGRPKVDKDKNEGNKITINGQEVKIITQKKQAGRPLGRKNNKTLKLEQLNNNKNIQDK